MRAKESLVPPKTAMATDPPLSCSAVLMSGRLMSHWSEVAFPPAIITASAPLRLAPTIDELHIQTILGKDPRLLSRPRRQMRRGHCTVAHSHFGKLGRDGRAQGERQNRLSAKITGFIGALRNWSG